MVLAQSLHEKVPPYLVGTERLAHYTVFFILKTVLSDGNAFRVSAVPHKIIVVITAFFDSHKFVAKGSICISGDDYFIPTLKAALDRRADAAIGLQTGDFQFRLAFRRQIFRPRLSVFANRLIQRINDLHYCTIVGNIDKSDIEKGDIKSFDNYDFIVIAIFNSAIVELSVKLLLDKGIDKNKILCIEKENLTFEMLPDEVKNLWYQWI